MAEAAEATNITVEKITDRGKYSTVKCGDVYYNVWDQLVADRLKQGEDYTVMVTHKTSQDPNTGENKTFHNIVGLSHPNFAIEDELEAVMPGTKTANPKPISPAPKPAPLAQLDFMIDVRKTTLQCATTLFAAGVITQKAMDKTMREFERYIVQGNLPEQKSSSAVNEAVDINDFVIE